MESKVGASREKHYPREGCIPDSPSFFFGILVAVLFFGDWEWFTKIMTGTLWIFAIWCFSAYSEVLTSEEQKPKIPQEVREPLEGKKWKDYDYYTDTENCNIFFFMWAAHASALIAPYEVLIYELSHDDLLNAQELNHAAIQTNWNKQLEKQTGCKLYSYWQLKFWKPIMFNWLKKYSIRLNLAVGCALEAMFCWICYLYCWNNGFLYKRLSFRSWVWSYHLLEEVEHTHISVPEMRQGLKTWEKVLCWFVFDVFIIVPILVLLVPITSIIYFPKKTLSVAGIQDLCEYFLFISVMIPFAAIGQFCEMVIGLNWRAGSLENLWNQWYEQHYVRDCFIDGEEMFKSEVPPECAAKNEAVMKKLRKSTAKKGVFNANAQNYKLPSKNVAPVKKKKVMKMENEDKTMNATTDITSIYEEDLIGQSQM